MNIFKTLSIVVAGAAFITPLFSIKVEAATINQINPADLTGTTLTTFEDVTGGTQPGTNYDEILKSNAASFAERFVGQTLSSNGVVDVLSDTAIGPLTLQVGKPGQNLNVIAFAPPPATNSSNTLTGIGPTGLNGEGAFAVLFDVDQSQLGFQLVGGATGSATATVNFFKRDGFLLETIALSGLTNSSYGFSRDGGLNDIAGFSIYNNAPSGVGFDNLRYGMQGVPNDPTPIPFEFSSGLGILILGAWGAIVMLKTKVQNRKVLDGGSLKINDGQAESV